MKKWSFFLFFSLLVYSCTTPPSDHTCNSNSQSNIHFADPEPDFHLTSVSSWLVNTYSSDSCLYPSTEHSSESIIIDVDEDGIYDFTFKAEHIFNDENWNMINTCDRYAYYLHVVALSTDDRIVSITNSFSNQTFVDYLDSNETIGYDSKFSPFYSSSLHIQIPSHLGGSPIYSHSIPANAFMGFKIIRNSNTYFGWIKLGGDKSNLYIRSWAMDHTPGNCIGAGVH